MTTTLIFFFFFSGSGPMIAAGNRAYISKQDVEPGEGMQQSVLQTLQCTLIVEPQVELASL